MPRSTDRIVTTHAGSLPRPDDVVEMIGAASTASRLTRRRSRQPPQTAVADIVKQQRDAGIDVVSDGELSKPGFSNYINDRFTGFEGCAEFQPTTSPTSRTSRCACSTTPAMAHLVFANCVDEVAVKDPEAVQRDIDRLKRATGDTAAERGVHGGAISPARSPSTSPTSTTARM